MTACLRAQPKLPGGPATPAPPSEHGARLLRAEEEAQATPPLQTVATDAKKLLALQQAMLAVGSPSGPPIALVLQVARCRIFAWSRLDCLCVYQPKSAGHGNALWTTSQQPLWQPRRQQIYYMEKTAGSSQHASGAWSLQLQPPQQRLATSQMATSKGLAEAGVAGGMTPLACTPACTHNACSMSIPSRPLCHTQDSMQSGWHGRQHEHDPQSQH